MATMCATAAILACPAAGWSQFADPLDPDYDRQTNSSAAASSTTNAQQTARNAGQTQASTDTDNTYAPDQITGGGDASTRRRAAASVVGDDERRSGSTPRAAAPPNEFETFVSAVADKPLRRFGAQLLTPSARDFTTSPTTIVPPDYRLNPGDQLVLGLTGSVQTSDLRLVINSEGKVFIPRVGAVDVGGVRYGDLQSVLTRALSRQYRDFTVSITSGGLHGITVYVTGFAQTPGSYTVSSLSTLVNAVLAAGGPAPGGSFRSIQLKRGGRLVANFDLYDLLLKGDKSADAILQDGDVIFIAPAGVQAAVIGSVNSEAIYEARPGETVQDFLLYAGGVNTVADDARVLVLDPLRLDGSGWRELTPRQAMAEPIRRGELVRVLSNVGIARPLEQQSVLVTVSGEVAKPGRYYLPAGVSLADVVAKAGGLTSKAYPFGSVITRESVRDEQRLSFDRALRDSNLLLTAAPLVSNAGAARLQPARLSAIQSLIDQLGARKPDGRILLNVGYNATALPGDMQLQNNDTIYVPPRPTTIGVFGAVPSPGSFQYTSGLSLRLVIARAGGVQRIGDRSKIFVVRANGMVLPHKAGMLGQPALPGDLVYVPVATDRGEFWDRLRDLSSVLLTGAIAGASIAAISN